MNAILEKNLSLLKEHRSDFFGSLMPYLHDTNPRRIDSHDKSTLIWTNSNNLDERLELMPPQKELERTLAHLVLQQTPRVLVWLGVGDGRHCKAYKSPLRPATVQSEIYVEKNPRIFLCALACEDWSSEIINPLCHFVVGVPEHLISFFLAKILLSDRDMFSFCRRVAHMGLFPSLANDGSYYINVVKSWNDAYDKISSCYQSLSEDAFRGLMNLIHNFSKIEKSYLLKDLTNLLSGKPALLIGAGPSLNEHWDQLKKYHKNFFTVACDAAVPAMLKNNIAPDLIVTIERVRAVEAALSILPSDSQIPIVTLPTVHPNALSAINGKIFYVTRDSAFGKWLWPTESNDKAGASVASLALEVLRVLNCQKIYFIGHDLAYHRDGKTSHANDVPEAVSSYALERKDNINLLGNNGQPILSNPVWQRFLTEHVERIAFFHLDVTNVIPLEMGAQIIGTKHQTPDEFWRQASQSDILNVQDIIAECLKNKPMTILDENLIFDTVDDLRKLNLRILDFLQDLTQIFLNEIEPKNEKELSSKVEDYQSSWRMRSYDLLRSLNFRSLNLIWPLFETAHLNITSEREIHDGITLEYKSRLAAYLLKTESWLQELLIWSSRAIHLMNKKLDGSSI